MIKKLTFILPLLLLSLFSFKVMADDEKDVKDLPVRERIYIGGYLGLQIGTITSVNISPTVAYRFTNRITGGVGGTYQYYRDRGWGLNPDYYNATHIFGGSVFTRYNITRQFFAQAEYEALNLDSQMGYGLDNISGNRFWEQNYFLGGGYRAMLGPRAFLNLMLLYNFNNQSVVYYQNPIFRIGVDVRL